MELNLIFWGMVFLFHPIVNVIDILPDFIGYSLILAGLRRLRDLSPDLEESRRPFYRLLAVSIGRTVVTIALIFGSIGSYLMIFTFVFSLLEMIFVLSAFPKLFNGLNFLGSICGSTPLIRSCGTLSVLTVTFFAARAVGAAGPDLLLYLFVNEEGGVLLNAYRLPMFVITFAITLIFGIVCLILFFRLRKQVVHDDAFLAAVNERYRSHVEVNTSLFLRRAFASGFSFWICGTVFLLDPYLDGIDFLPDFLSPLFFLLAILCLRRYLNIPPYQYVLGIASLVAGIDAWSMQTKFSARYYGAEFSRIPAVMQELYSAEIATCFSKFLLLLMLLSFLPLMQQAVRRYACHENINALESITEQDASLRRSFVWRYALYAVLAVPASVLCAIGTYRLHFDPFFPLYGGAATAAFIAFSSILLSRIRTSIDERHV